MRVTAPFVTRYKVVADGVEKNIELLLAIAADIDEQEKDDLT
jgi:hypothetical protein